MSFSWNLHNICPSCNFGISTFNNIEPSQGGLVEWNTLANLTRLITAPVTQIQSHKCFLIIYYIPDPVHGAWINFWNHNQVIECVHIPRIPVLKAYLLKVFRVEAFGKRLGFVQARRLGSYWYYWPHINKKRPELVLTAKGWPRWHPHFRLPTVFIAWLNLQKLIFLNC